MKDILKMMHLMAKKKLPKLLENSLDFQFKRYIKNKANTENKKSKNKTNILTIKKQKKTQIK